MVVKEAPDPLAGEVTVTAKLEESGLTLKAKSRTIAAIDRLIGSAVDIPGAYVEGVSRRIRARNAIKEELIKIEGEQAADKLRQLPDLSERALGHLIAEQDRKQANREAVGWETLDVLQALPPPGAEATDASAETEALEDDWINVFSDFAGNASSDRLRKLWGQILAGEVRKPGSFSLTTLRVISELDREIAIAFEEVVRLQFRNGLLLKPDKLENDRLLKYTFLEEVGLLQEASGSLIVNLEVGPDGFCYYVEGDHVVKAKPSNGQKLSVSVIKITRVGVQLASILVRASDFERTLAIGEALTDSAEVVEILKVTNRLPDGTFNYVLAKKIK